MMPAVFRNRGVAMRTSNAGPLLAALLAAAGSAAAHHSPAVFDRTRQIVVEGVVTEFRWGNPHSWIHLDVETEGGKRAWTIEMDPASHLGRDGWTSRTLKPGDRVAVTVYPLRNDEPGGQYISVRLPDGKVMDEGRQRLEVVRPPDSGAE